MSDYNRFFGKGLYKIGITVDYLLQGKRCKLNIVGLPLPECIRGGIFEWPRWIVSLVSFAFEIGLPGFPPKMSNKGAGDKDNSFGLRGFHSLGYWFNYFSR